MLRFKWMGPGVIGDHEGNHIKRGVDFDTTQEWYDNQSPYIQQFLMEPDPIKVEALPKEEPAKKDKK
jgi:hypothetical protein